MTGLSNLNYSFGFNGRKMFDFCLWRKKIGWVLIIDHLISLSKLRYFILQLFECHTMCFSHLGVKLKTVLWLKKKKSEAQRKSDS